MPTSINTKIANMREGKLTKSQRKLLDYCSIISKR